MEQALSLGTYIETRGENYSLDVLSNQTTVIGKAFDAFTGKIKIPNSTTDLSQKLAMSFNDSKDSKNSKDLYLVLAISLLIFVAAAILMHLKKKNSIFESDFIRPMESEHATI